MMHFMVRNWKLLLIMGTVGPCDLRGVRENKGIPVPVPLAGALVFLKGRVT